MATTKSPKLFTVGEIAARAGVATSALRFYEDEGLLSPTRQGMSRIYSLGDRWRLGDLQQDSGQ